MTKASAIFTTCSACGCLHWDYEACKPTEPDVPEHPNYREQSFAQDNMDQITANYRRILRNEMKLWAERTMKRFEETV